MITLNPETAPDTAAPVPWLDSEPAPPDSTGQTLASPATGTSPERDSLLSLGGRPVALSQPQNMDAPRFCSYHLRGSLCMFFINDWMKYFSKAITTGQWIVPSLPLLRSSLINLGGIVIAVALIQAQSKTHFLLIRTTNHLLSKTNPGKS